MPNADEGTVSIGVVGIRECCRQLFLRLYKKHGLDKPSEMATATELSIHTHMPLLAPTKSASRVSDTAYYHRVCQIYAVTDPSQYIRNPELIELLRSGEVHPSKLAYMSPAELFPSRWETMKKRLKLEQDKTGNVGFRTTKFKCSRCGMNDCSYYQLQTRSADEPMTTFVTCLTCEKRWRA